MTADHLDIAIDHLRRAEHSLLHRARAQGASFTGRERVSCAGREFHPQGASFIHRARDSYSGRELHTQGANLILRARVDPQGETRTLSMKLATPCPLNSRPEGKTRVLCVENHAQPCVSDRLRCLSDRLSCPGRPSSDASWARCITSTHPIWPAGAVFCSRGCSGAFLELR